jgi:hypothetical protein
MEERDGNLKNLVERLLQMNMVIIEEMQEQRRLFFKQRTLLTAPTAISENVTTLLPPKTENITTSPPPKTTTCANVSNSSPSRPTTCKIYIKPKEFNGTVSENVVTWFTSLEEVMTHCLSSDNDSDRISLAVSLLSITALQRFVNLTL